MDNETPKRGYLAQISTIPPLIYPFQYNPSELSFGRKVPWKKRGPAPMELGKGKLSDFGARAKNHMEVFGLRLSGSELKGFEGAENGSVEFKFVIDGRERRPGEPKRRRNDDGDILGDIAVLQSFVYPQVADLIPLASAAFGDGPAIVRLNPAVIKEPPGAVLVFGSTSFDGYVTELKIVEKQFNSKLDPVRAEVSVTMVEKVDSATFMLNALKRVARTTYHTAYEDIGDVLF